MKTTDKDIQVIDTLLGALRRHLEEEGEEISDEAFATYRFMVLATFSYYAADLPETCRPTDADYAKFITTAGRGQE